MTAVASQVVAPAAAIARKTAYRPDVDGLRAVAVIAVVLFHGFPSLLPGGFIGVDVFFVISGFLITRQILAALEAKSFSIADFYWRRIQRIFPALLLVQVAALLFGLVFLFSIELQALAKDLLASTAFCSNIWYWFSGGYFEQDSALRVLLHLWSLGVEEQYYLVWPLVMALFWRRQLVLLAAVLLLTMLSLGLNLVESPSHPNAAFYLPLTRFWELAAGALTCLAAASPREFGARAATLMSSVGALAIVGGLAFINEQQIYPGWRAVAPTLGTALIILAGGPSWLNRRVLAQPAMVAIGLISYPLYLWHWPLIVVGRILDASVSNTVVTTAAMTTSILLATLTYRFVDRPLRTAPSSLATRRRRALVLLLAMVAMGVVAAGIVARHGLPGRFTNANALQDEAQDFTASEPCERQFPAAEFCIAPTPLAGASIALVGDSHALHLYPGLIATIPDGSRRVLAVGAGNCPPFQGIDIRIGLQIKPCTALFNGAIDRVLRDPAIRTLVVSSYAISTASGGLDYQSGDHLRLVLHGVTSAEASQAVYLAGLARLFDDAAAAGKRVVFVYDTPELDFDPLSCLPRPLMGLPVGFTCSVARAKVMARQGALRQAVGQLLASHPSVVALDPMGSLCDGVRCRAAVDGHLLYRDRDHLSTWGSTWLMGKLLNSRPNALDPHAN